MLVSAMELVLRKTEQPWRLWVACSVVVYCLSAAAVPIYNKLAFSGGSGAGGGDLRPFPYPIATAFLQLGLVAICLAVANMAAHSFRHADGDSWLLGPHFLYKVRHIAPVGIFFGLKYGVTNWGLQLVPIGVHLLLQSTDMLWTVVLARSLNGEVFGILEHVAVLLSTTGSVLIGLRTVDTLDAPAIPLLINLLTPFMLALCVCTLRKGAVELFDEGNRLAGTVTATEFTAIKLTLSSATALVLSLLLESGHVPQAGSGLPRPPWWVALPQEPPRGIFLLVLGGVFVLIFQVNLTWLTGLTSAVTVGIVGGLKVVPQWLLNALFQLSLDLSPLNLAGAALVFGASALYAAAMSYPFMLVMGTDWRPCWKARDPEHSDNLFTCHQCKEPWYAQVSSSRAYRCVLTMPTWLPGTWGVGRPSRPRTHLWSSPPMLQTPMLAQV